MEVALESQGVTGSLVEPIEAQGDPLVGDLVIFVYTHGHMGWGLEYYAPIPATQLSVVAEWVIGTIVKNSEIH